MRNYLRLIRFVRPHAGLFCTAVGCMLATTIFKSGPITLLIPAIDRIIADKLIAIPDRSQVPVIVLDLVDKANAMPRGVMLDFIIIAAAVITLISAVSLYGQTYFMNKVSHRVIRDLRQLLYRKMVHLPLGFYSKQRAGELVSRITYDTGIVRDAISEGLMDALLQPMQLIANITVLLGIRYIFGIPWSFVFVLTVVMPMVIVPVIKIGKALKKISHSAQSSMADMNASLYETVSGIRIVQGFAMEGYEKTKFRGINWAYYRAMMRQVARNLLIHPITELVVVICGCTIIWIGGHRVIAGQMSAGALIAFMVALLSLKQPFKRIGRLHGINQIAMAAAERIFSIMDEPDGPPELEKPVFVSGVRESVVFRDIRFSYDDEKPVLNDISFEIKAGQIVALVGSSGSGKTTIANLLPRYYDPQKGEVILDGTPLTRIDLKSLRNQVGIVTQETILFNDTVSANIAYGRKELPQEAIERAAQVANAHAFIKKLPQGYQTVIGDRGFRLSGGEKQRLSIARAVLKNPPILILDEATSALDTESERLVQEAIQNLMKGRTALVIAHRLSTIKNADRIIVLQNGRIQESGNHEKLFENDGLYRRLYEMQFNA